MSTTQPAPISPPASRSTKQEQFYAKIRLLQGYYDRLKNKTPPLPNGRDLANSLKYFHQFLVSLVRDCHPCFQPDKRCYNTERYPDLDYQGLYKVLLQLLEVVPEVEIGVQVFGQSVLLVLSALVPFLSEDCLNTLPVTLAMSLSNFPAYLHYYVVEFLIGYLMPLLLGNSKPDDPPTYAELACPSLIMTVLQYCSDKQLQARFMESLMCYKKNANIDLLAVMAYGPQSVLNPAGQLLFYYFPSILSGSTEDGKFQYPLWPSPGCMHRDCFSSGSNTAIKMSVDAVFAAKAGNQPPPLYLCGQCAGYAENVNDSLMFDLLKATGKVFSTCEVKDCVDDNKQSKYLCFSTECTRGNGNRPLSMCESCHVVRHKSGGEGAQHMVQWCQPDLWSTVGPHQAYVVEAIVRLLQEAEPLHMKRLLEMGHDNADTLEFHRFEGENFISHERSERHMLSRFGVWLLVKFCSDPSCECPERLGRLIAVVMQWMDATVYVPDGFAGQILEDLKTQQVCPWLKSIRQSHFNLFCSCLMPNPPSFAQVGSYWDILINRVRQHKEGLYRLCCLIPYDILSTEVWETVMPEWMETIKSEVPPSELYQFKVLLRKIFDPFMSPYKFALDTTLSFLKKGLESSIARLQRQSLVWIQMLSQLDIVVKINILLNMFMRAVETITESAESIATMFPFPLTAARNSPTSPTNVTSPTSSGEFLSPVELTSVNSTLSCFIVMLDLLVKQINLQYQRKGRVLSNNEREDIKSLLSLMLDVSWGSVHSDHVAVCQLCQLTAVWFQLAFILIEKAFPKDRSGMDEENSVGFGSMFARSNSQNASLRSHDDSLKSEELFQDGTVPSAKDCTPGSSIDELESPEDQLQGSQDDTTLTEASDSIGALSPEDAKDVKRTLFDGLGSANSNSTGLPGFNLLQAASGNINWNEILEQYPQLKLTLGFLKEIPRQSDPLVLLNLMKSLEIMCVRGEYLRAAAEEDVDFLFYLQEVFLIPNLWSLLQADSSELSKVVVPILTHCICLPFGAEKLAEEVEQTFESDDWRNRFNGVEKVTVLARFLSKDDIKSNALSQSALAYCFTYLVGAVEDVCPAVSTRAIAQLDTICDTSLKLLYKCLELQFDSVQPDRLLLIHTFRVLHQVVAKQSPLTCQFFLERFKCLLNECANTLVGRTTGNNMFNTQSFSDTSSDSRMELTKTGQCLAKWTRAQTPRSFKQSSSSATTKREKFKQTKADRAMAHRYTYTFQSSGDKVTYSQQTDMGEASSTRQRQPGGTSPQTPPIDLAEKAFLGGRIQRNLPTLVEEDSVDRDDRGLGDSTFPSLDLSHFTAEDEMLHQFIMLLLDFMSFPGEKNKDARMREKHEICQMKGHVAVLMNYNLIICKFTGSTRKIRSSPVFQAYMSRICHVLDNNTVWGTEFLHMTLQLLLFCPAPEKTDVEQTPTYTLGRLAQHVRQSWLITLLIILYKYQFDSYKKQIENLIHIVLNTVKSHNHRCYPQADDNLQGVGKTLIQPSDTRRTIPSSSTRNDLLATSMGPQADQTSNLGLKDGMGSRDTKMSGNKLSSLDSPGTADETPLLASAGKRQISENKNGGNTDDNRKSSTQKNHLTQTTFKEQVMSNHNTEGSFETGYENGTLVEDTSMQSRRSSNVSSRGAPSPTPSASSRSIATMGTEDGLEDEPVFERCLKCGCELFDFDEETLNLSIVILSTLLHRDPAMTTPLLLTVLQSVGRKAIQPTFPFQEKSNLLAPGSTMGVAKQFLRCVLFKLAPHALFPEIFRSKLSDPQFLPAIAIALSDFPTFNQMGPIQYLLQGVMSGSKQSLKDRLMVLLEHMDTYLSCISLESPTMWQDQLNNFENFFKKVPYALPMNCNMTPALHMLNTIIRALGSNSKTLLPPFAQVISYTIKKGHCDLQMLLNLCAKCVETFHKERNKLYLTRAVTQELVQAIKFKSWLSDATLQNLMQFVCVDAGTRMDFGTGDSSIYKLSPGVRTKAMDCVQPYIMEAVDFIKDWNFTPKPSKESRRMTPGNTLQTETLQADSFSIQLKAGIAQLVALELTKHPRDGKIYTRAMSWLKNAPSASQLGRVELLECVANIRLLAWLLHGSLSHTVNCTGTKVICHPIAYEESSHVADYILIVLASFAESSKEQLLNMPSLYHAFNLSELWTLYVEHHMFPKTFHGEFHSEAQTIILEFWSSITPGVLHLLQHATDLTEIVCIHFLTLMEALQECNSAALPKLLPTWIPLMEFCYPKLTESTKTRLERYYSRSQQSMNKEACPTDTLVSRWLKRLQVKMAYAEQSSSNAQFFVV